MFIVHSHSLFFFIFFFRVREDSVLCALGVYIVCVLLSVRPVIRLTVDFGCCCCCWRYPLFRSQPVPLSIRPSAGVCVFLNAALCGNWQLYHQMTLWYVAPAKTDKIVAIFRVGPSPCDGNAQSMHFVCSSQYMSDLFRDGGWCCRIHLFPFTLARCTLSCSAAMLQTNTHTIQRKRELWNRKSNRQSGRRRRVSKVGWRLTVDSVRMCSARDTVADSLICNCNCLLTCGALLLFYFYFSYENRIFRFVMRCYQR